MRAALQRLDARVHRRRDEQECADQPVDVLNAQHRTLPCRTLAASFARSSWRCTHTMRSAWITNAAIAVGSAHSAIANGSRWMPWLSKKRWISSTRAEREEHVFAEEAADVVGRRRERTHAHARRLVERRVARGRRFAHRREQRTHGLRVSGDVDQAEHREQLAQREIGDQQPREREPAESCDPRLRALAKAVAFEQADHRQRQREKQQHAIARERRAEQREQIADAHARRDAADDAGDHDDEHRISAQREAGDDDRDAEQRPCVQARRPRRERGDATPAASRRFAQAAREQSPHRLDRRARRSCRRGCATAPSARLRFAARRDRDRLRDRGVDIIDDRAGLVARHQRAIGLVAPIGERFVRDGKARRFARARQLAVGEADQDQRAIEIAHRAGDRIGERAILRRHVVERAVRLHVMQRARRPRARSPASAPIW